jgi:tetratricopeptide (TPR) repeat protein
MRVLLALTASALAWNLLQAAPAWAQVPVTLQADPGSGTALDLMIRGAVPEDTELDGRDVVLRFAGAIDPQQVEAAAQDGAAWIETIEYGYDSLLIRFAEGVEVLVEPAADGVTLFASRPAIEEAPATEAATDPQRIRLDYYRALAQIESGAVAEGRAILVGLLRADPRNIEVMLLLARAEEQLGRPRQAVALYDRALALDPNLPGAIRDRQRLARDLADTARIATRYQDVENGETQIITTLDGRVSSDEGLSLDYRLEHRHMEAGAVTRRDGSVERFEGDRQRATLTLTPPRQGNVQIAGSLYASTYVAGAGVAVDLDEGTSRMGLEARWSEPDFNFVEGIVFGGARDRLAADWQWQAAEVYEFTAGTALNRYSLEGDHAGTGAEFVLEARRRLPEQWLLSTVGYRFDAEYILNSQSNPASGADLLPLSSREGHTIDATAEREFGPYIRAQGIAGYTYDRLNGGGPLAEINLIYEPLVDLEISTTLGTSLNESRGTENQLFYGGLSLRTRF